jgi:hypothetical protein
MTCSKVASAKDLHLLVPHGKTTNGGLQATGD